MKGVAAINERENGVKLAQQLASSVNEKNENSGSSNYRSGGQPIKRNCSKQQLK